MKKIFFIACTVLCFLSVSAQRKSDANKLVPPPPPVVSQLLQTDTPVPPTPPLPPDLTHEPPPLPPIPLGVNPLMVDTPSPVGTASTQKK